MEIGDRRAAIRAAVAAARTGDAVVIAGKGHELGQDIAGVVHPFSDRVELMTALTELPTSVQAVTPPTPPPATPPTPPPATPPTPRDRATPTAARPGDAVVHRGALVIAMTLAQVAEAIGATAPAGADGILVRSVEFDTRRITPGALFVALHGERVDGHAFAATAAAAGAVAVLGSGPIEGDLPLLIAPATTSDSPTGDAEDNDVEHANAAVLTALAALASASVTALVAKHGLQVIGVTGSSGKTSTKDLIAAVLRSGLTGSAQQEPMPWSPRRSRSTTNSATRTRRCGRTRTPGSWCWSCPRAASGTSRCWPRPHRRGSAPCSTSGRRTSASSAPSQAIATAKSELVQALPSRRGRRGGDPERRRPAGGGDGGGDERRRW